MALEAANSRASSETPIDSFELASRSRRRSDRLTVSVAGPSLEDRYFLPASFWGGVVATVSHDETPFQLEYLADRSHVNDLSS